VPLLVLVLLPLLVLVRRQSVFVSRAKETVNNNTTIINNDNLIHTHTHTQGVANVQKEGKRRHLSSVSAAAAAASERAVFEKI